MPRSSRMDVEALLRAAAVCAVVFNHAHVYGGHTTQFTGGMTVLLLLSGHSFARFTLVTGSRRLVSAGLIKLGVTLLMPSILLVLVSFAIKRTVSWPELLMVSNWSSGKYLSLFPIWYPQVVLQLLAGLAVLLWTPTLWRRFCGAPLGWSLALFGSAVLVRAGAPLLWQTDALHHRLPHLLAWNFILGWVIFFGRRTMEEQGRLWMCTICASAAFIGWPATTPQPYGLSIAAALLIYMPQISVAPAMARVASILSQSAFTIFLLHTIALGAFRAIAPWRSPTTASLVSILACVTVWLVVTSAWRALRQPPPKPSGFQAANPPVGVT
ncbi:MAG: hypothetical protein ABW063_08720 [Caulobacter sp.]